MGFSAGIKEFEEEIIVIRIAVSFPSQGLDFVVNPFNLSRGDVEREQRSFGARCPSAALSDVRLWGHASGFDV